MVTAITQGELSSNGGHPLPPIDVDTIRERLLMREGGVGASAVRGSLSKCASRFREFSDTVRSASDPASNNHEDLAAAIEDQKQALERELRLHDLEMRKLMMVAQSASVELAHYDASEAQIERSMDECKSEIEELKQELRNEKIVRRHREEYEALAKAATARQPRQKTEQRVQSLESEVATVTAKELRVRKDLQLREKQFQLVVQSVFNLQSSIAEDGSIEEGLIENSDEAIGEDGDSGDAAVTTMDTSL